MATAFNYYQPTAKQAAVNPALSKQLADAQSQKRLADKELQRSRQFVPGGFAGYRQAPTDTSAEQRVNELSRKLGGMQAQAGGGATDPAAASRDKALAMTAGVSDRIMNDEQIAAALGQIESGMKTGPYSDAIQQQIVNRNADQSAAAEAANADQLRNDAAARGLDPSAALRQGQAQRQQSNIAFQGDLNTKATLANYDAQQNAARSLASAKLSQFGQAQPGYGQAANYLANEQFTSPRVSSVQNNSAPTIAFSGSSGGINGSGSNIPNPNYSTSTLPSYSNVQQQVIAPTTSAPTAFKPKTNSPHVNAPKTNSQGTAFSYKPPNADGYNATGAFKYGPTQTFGY